MLGSLKKKIRPEKGQVVVFTVLLLPLILGVVVLVIEIGNIYVHYSELQHIADTAALTRNAANAKKVVEANSKNFSSKDDFKITITTYEGTPKDNATASKVFCVKLDKNLPLIFIKVFKFVGDTYPLKAGAAISEDGVLLDNSDLENFKLTPVTP